MCIGVKLRLAVVSVESDIVRARLHGATFRVTPSMRLEADWGMKRHRATVVHTARRWQLHVIPSQSGHLRAS